MEIKIIECAMSNAALEEVKRQYGADGLIVSNIATATKNLIILAVENVSMREPQKTQETVATKVDGEHVTTNSTLTDAADVLRGDEISLKPDFESTAKDSFRQILDELSSIKFAESEVSGTESEDFKETGKAQTGLQPAEEIEVTGVKSERSDGHSRDNYSVDETIYAAALNHTEVEVKTIIDTSSAEKDRDEQFALFKASMSVTALELTSLLQSTADEILKETQPNKDKNVLEFKANVGTHWV
jgi:flagellar biosynthesis GTPase FlhF